MAIADDITERLDEEGIPYERNVTLTDEPRLPGTDYTHVTVAKQNGDWMDTVPDIGDELTLRMRVRVTEKGKRLTDDGLQATVKVEVVGSPTVVE